MKSGIRIIRTLMQRAEDRLLARAFRARLKAEEAWAWQFYAAFLVPCRATRDVNVYANTEVVLHSGKVTVKDKPHTWKLGIGVKGIVYPGGAKLGSIISPGAEGQEAMNRVPDWAWRYYPWWLRPIRPTFDVNVYAHTRVVLSKGKVTVHQGHKLRIGANLKGMLIRDVIPGGEK